MRRVRPTPLDILLVLALANLVGFVFAHDHLDPDSPWLALWPNITVDLFSVWLVARIIEGFIASREKRRSDALSLRGAMNYTMSRAREVLPEPWPSSINTLTDEVAAMRTNADRADLSFTREVRDYIRRAASDLESVASDANRLRDAQVLVRETRNDLDIAFRAARKDRTHPEMGEFDSLDHLRRELDVARDHSSAQAHAEVGGAVAAVRHEAQQHRLSRQVGDALEAHLDAVEASLRQRADLEPKIEAYATLVKTKEIELLGQLV